ncbi:MAG: DUF4157 domain-containing protein [Clostridia bacterium]|nr:DUF4157 domain-containing protein [Clostridia bacterium]
MHAEKALKGKDYVKGEGPEKKDVQRKENPVNLLERAQMAPHTLSYHDVMQLHKIVGNETVGRLFSQGVEKALMGGVGEEPVEGELEAGQKSSAFESYLPLQMKGENKTGMPDGLKSRVESLSGVDMSEVRVHYNSSKPAEVGALAYTQGTDIHVAPGQERHLPHEAWHVVQQAQGRVRPTMQLKGVAVNDDAELEREADVMGKRAAQKFCNSEDLEIKNPKNVYVSTKKNTAIQRKVVFRGEDMGRLNRAWLKVEEYDKKPFEFFQNHYLEFYINGVPNSHPMGAKAETNKGQRSIYIYNINVIQEGQLLRLMTHEIEHMSRGEWIHNILVEDNDLKPFKNYHFDLVNFVDEKRKSDSLLGGLMGSNEFSTMVEYLNEMMDERICVLPRLQIDVQGLATDERDYLTWVRDAVNGLKQMVILNDSWMMQIHRNVNAALIQMNGELRKRVVEWITLWDGHLKQKNFI